MVPLDYLTEQCRRGRLWVETFYTSLGFTEITKANWTPWMHDLAQRQIDGGIDMDTRVYMELAKAKGL